MPLKWVMCLSSVTLCSISLCMYFREVVGFNVCIFYVCLIHCVSSGVGRRGNFSNVFFKWAPLVVLSRYSFLVIGDLIHHVRICMVGLVILYVWQICVLQSPTLGAHIHAHAHQHPRHEFWVGMGAI